MGLTVPNLSLSQVFFIDVLGFQQVGEKPDYPAVFVSDGHTMITLWQQKDGADQHAFDRHHNIGLHHLALKVEDQDSLETLHQRLRNTDGVEIEFAPEPLGSSPMQHMMTLIPGGIRVEFIAAG